MEECLPPTTVFIKSEPLEDLEEETVCTPVDFHEIIPTKPKPYVRKKKKPGEIIQCKECGKVYTEHWHLTRHATSTHGAKIFKCTQCDKSFSLKQYLKKHMITHTGERNFRCEVCNKSFTQRGSLNLHKLIHTGKKNYLCQICNKPFTHQSGLSIHVLTHTSKKKYPCELCQKLFKQKKSMKHHLEFYCKKRPGYNTDASDKTEVDLSFIKKDKESEEENSDFEDPVD